MMHIFAVITTIITSLLGRCSNEWGYSRTHLDLKYGPLTFCMVQDCGTECLGHSTRSERSSAGADYGTRTNRRCGSSLIFADHHDLLDPCLAGHPWAGLCHHAVTGHSAADRLHRHWIPGLCPVAHHCHPVRNMRMHAGLYASQTSTSISRSIVE